MSLPVPLYDGINFRDFANKYVYKGTSVCTGLGTGQQSVFVLLNNKALYVSVHCDWQKSTVQMQCKRIFVQ